MCYTIITKENYENQILKGVKIMSIMIIGTIIGIALAVVCAYFTDF